MPCWNWPHHQPGVVRVEGLHVDAWLLLLRVPAWHKIQEPFAVGQEVRPQVRAFMSRLIKLRDRRRRPTASGYSMDEASLREENNPLAVPSSAINPPSPNPIGEGLRRAATHGNGLQVAARKKSDEATISRPEAIGPRPLRADKGLAGRRIERTVPQPRYAR